MGNDMGIVFDIETADADQLFGYDRGAFVRLCGWQPIDLNGVTTGPFEISADADELVDVLHAADFVTGHNILNFDLLALSHHNHLNYERLAAKSFDTLVVEKHLEPVAARGMQPDDFYRLNGVATRYGVAGKSYVDFAGKLDIVRRVKGDKVAERMLKARETAAAKAVRDGRPYSPTDRFGVLDVLKDVYGGYDMIPVDDPDYRVYLGYDVGASGGVYREQVKRVRAEEVSSQRYIRREHYTMAATGRVTIQGARVDTDLTMRRWAEGQARLEASKQMLHEKHGMPLEGKKPHTTNPGKAAFRAALLATGISERALDANWPHNKDGSLAMGKDVLTGMIEIFDRTRPEAAELCRTILAMNGERTVYGTVLAHLVGDRVHPYIGPDQASGRWSMKNPGLTVLGKRGGKARERAMILADEGDVLVAIDADQIDARMIAALSQDPEYMKLFAPGVDLHSEVAFRVWPDMAKHGGDCHQLDEFHDHGCGVKAKCHCELRDRAKVFGHGWNYGMQAKTMAERHGVPFEVAKGFCDGMASAFRVLAAWQIETRAAAGALGFNEEAPENDSYRILHTVFGRPVRVERNRAFTQACAQLGQGSTRDGMAEAILALPAEKRRRIRAIVHDEIVVSIPDGPDAQDRAQALADSMAFEVRGVKITFGCSRVAKSWAGCYGEQYEQAA